ncbi:MAG: cyclic nucleotide-binding domain-containing protein [Burkholderiales bacterium]|nr:cyclic nucleotide-binding domain-containing protein [Burkholderiales bacterium]MDE2454449.1 cyclic nucleotide-binding domain-containing protein [Burkholderiales bacterium]
MLRTPQAAIQLDAEGARCIVAYMRLVSFSAGTTLFHEGDDGRSGYLLLVLDGEVSVDMGDVTPAEAVAVSVLGPGSIVGEMSLLDGAPRSATCTALSAVQGAGLSRRGLEILIDEHPRVAARLLVGLAQRVSERLRALGQQLQMYAQLVARLQAELDPLRNPLRSRF